MLSCRHDSPVALLVATNRLVLCILATIGLSHSSSAAAQSVSHIAPGWVMETWTTEDGLPLNHLNGVTEDRDGVAWVVTFDGLVRFDGVEFETLRSGQLYGPPANRLIEIVPHPADGALWVFTEDRQLQRRQGAEVTDFVQPGEDLLRSLPSHATDTLLGVGHDGGLMRLDETPIPLRYTGQPLQSVATMPDGTLWMVTADGLLQVLANGTVETLSDQLPGSILVREAATGALLLLSEDGTMRLVDGAWEPLPETPFMRVSQPARPSRWGHTRSRVFLDGAPIVTLDSAISDLALSGERVWITTKGHGLSRIRPTALQTWRAPDGTVTNVQRLWREGQTLWAQGETQGWWPLHSAGEAPEPLPEVSAEIEANCPPWTWRFLTGTDGRRWLSCGDYIYRPTGEGWTGVLLPQRHQSGPAWTVADELWLGGERGAWVLRGDDWHEVTRPTGSLDGVLALLVLEDGSILLGGKDGLTRVAAGATTGEAVGSPIAIRHIRRDDRWLWIGTEERGLCVTDSTARAALRCLGEGSEHSTIHASLSDGMGRTWASSNHGIGVVADSDLRAFAAGGSAPAFLWLDERDGMRSAEGNGFVGDAAAIDTDGRLWFATQDGAVSIDPASFTLPEAPEVLWRPIAVGEDRRTPGPIRLLRDHAPLRVRWSTAAIPWADQVMFRYRLSADQPWSTPSTRRTLELPSLPAGDSALEVQARLGNQWGPSAVLPLYRTPALHERSVFPLLVLVLLISSLLGLAFTRNRYLTRINRQLEEQVAARTERLAIQNSQLNQSNAILEQHSRRLADQNRQLAVQAEMLRSRNQQIATLAQRLQELDHLKRQLIANLSHELRTPLALILGPLSTLLANAEANSQQARHLGIAIDSAGRLQELIAQLFDLSRAQAGGIRLRVRRIDLSRFAAELIHRFTPIAEQRGIRLVLASPAVPMLVWMDGDLIDKVLANLLSNALRFSPPDTTVEVHIHGEDGTVRVSVTDEGKGVAEKNRSKVFERFFQVDGGQSRAHDGAGLGLALVRELVELHGGSVGVQDGPIGASFWFELPTGVAHFSPDDIADTPSERRPTAPPAHAPSTDGARVLLVEDHQQLREYLAESLSERFSVLAAASGEEALAILDAEPVALVITDIMMPGMDGHELVRRIRARADGESCPVMFISARQELQDRVEGLELADDYLAKPFQTPELMARVSALLRRSRPPAAEVEPDEGPSAVLLAELTSRTDLHLHETCFNASALAKAMAMSPRTLQLKMRALDLPTPVEWLRAHRIERAQSLLRSGEHVSVGAVAAAVGMSHSYFSRTYAAHTGRSPREDLRD